MTKTQVRAALKPLLEKLGDLRAELDDLKCEVKETAEGIEPYEGKDELTDAQTERQEWMEDVASELEDLIQQMNEAEWNLEDK